MTTQIDVTFDFRDDTPAGKDPDLLSPTLREYHQILWSKQLSSGHTFTLTKSESVYLLHESRLGRFPLSSDAITTWLKGRAAKILKEIPSESLPPDLGYTIGSAIIFPGNRVDGAATINGARGFHPRIADRFDLTLEPIVSRTAAIRRLLRVVLEFPRVRRVLPSRRPLGQPSFADQVFSSFR